MAEQLTPIRVFARRLPGGGELSREDIEGLAATAGPIRTFGRGASIAEEGRRSRTIWLITKGWAFRQKMFREGRRKILAIMLPGELTEKAPVLPFALGHSVVAATDVEAQAIDRQQLFALCEDRPAVLQAMFVDELMQREVSEGWNAVLGGRSSEERLAYLFCETYYRLQARGLTRDNTFDFPVTQQEVGDQIGVSPVHVNRVLQSLRERELVIWASQQVTLPDPAMLAHLCQFNPEISRLADDLASHFGRYGSVTGVSSLDYPLNN